MHREEWGTKKEKRKGNDTFEPNATYTNPAKEGDLPPESKVGLVGGNYLRSNNNFSIVQKAGSHGFQIKMSPDFQYKTSLFANQLFHHDKQNLRT